MNLRVIVFIGIFGLIFGPIVWLAVDSAVSGGLKNKGNYYEVDLKAMSDFPFDQENGRVDDVPTRFRALDGKTVQLIGEVAPTGFTADGVDAKFELVYSVAKCCMTGTPQIQHFVKVTVPPDVRPELQREGSIMVRGTLHVDVTKDPETNKINGVYHVTAQEVSSL